MDAANELEKDTVADKELVEATPCEPDKPEDDCEEVNKKFLERCQKYRNCPGQDEEPVFVCQQKQCVSRYQHISISFVFWHFWG